MSVDSQKQGESYKTSSSRGGLGSVPILDQSTFLFSMPLWVNSAKTNYVYIDVFIKVLYHTRALQYWQE